MTRIILGAIAILLAVAAGLFFYVIPVRIDAGRNLVLPHEPYVLSAEAQALHATLDVADLHSDMLLWMRDPARRNDRGHTDLPRLRSRRADSRETGGWEAREFGQPN